MTLEELGKIFKSISGHWEPDTWNCPKPQLMDAPMRNGEAVLPSPISQQAKWMIKIRT